MSDIQEPFEGEISETAQDLPEGEEPEEALFKFAGEADEEAPEQTAQESREEEAPAEPAKAAAEVPEPMPLVPEPLRLPPEPPPASQPTAPAPKRRRPPSLFWPLVLVGAGVMLLLSNLGYVPWSSWNVLWRLWPVLLIALGVDVLFGRRSMGGAVLSGILMIALFGGVIALIFFAQNIPLLVEWSEPAEWQVKHIEYSLNGLEQAQIDIEWTSVPGYLGVLEDSNKLIEGDLAYNGELVFDVQERGDRADVTLEHHSAPGVWLGPFHPGPREEDRWEVWLSPDVRLDLTLDSGSGRCEFDLSDLQINVLRLDAGSGAVDLSLPSDSSFRAEIESGSGPLTIVLPRQVCARVDLDSGSGAFRPDDRFVLLEGERGDDGVWETENCGAADYEIEFEIAQGSGRIVIE